ncbi:MAG: divergent polysaccharide deacetylase family protein [Holosporaceae bacterium]|jgi:polysaccharide deacetylase 2 family uncharacterized protein YibQ|nr:divergent polysaccharide deacetylase family protein [Holosporaceae bacterium]
MKNKKLILAWAIFLGAAAAFVVGVEIYGNFKKERSSGYRYRIPIDGDILPEQFMEKKEDLIPEKKTEDCRKDFYERTKYGYLPKISRSGARVFDEYSACSEITSGKKLRLAVVLSENDAANPANIDAGLNGQKVTFIVPHHCDRLDEVVKTVQKGGHEFFLKIPVQFPVSIGQNRTITPFLVNAEAGDTLSKLFRLLASTKYALGIANVSPTLLTKSAKDMAIIAEALAERGVAFFDFEDSNNLPKEVAEKTGLIFISAAAVFESDDFDLSKLQDGSVLMIRREHLPNLIKILPADWTLAPISAAAKR